MGRGLRVARVKRQEYPMDLNALETATVVFPVRDYRERLDKIDRAIKAAEGESGTLMDEAAAADLKAEWDELKSESDAASKDVGLYVVVRELRRNEWRKLKADHPPRTDGEDAATDRVAGFNTDAGEDDLVYMALLEPEFSSRAAFDEWADSIGAGKFSTIAAQAFELIVRNQLAPKAPSASLTRSTD